jgi:hypothetical protein
MMSMSPEHFLDYVNHSATSSSADPGMRATAFVAFPLALCAVFPGPQASWQQSIYRLAFEQAQAAARRQSLFDRDWLGTWN